MHRFVRPLTEVSMEKEGFSVPAGTRATRRAAVLLEGDVQADEPDRVWLEVETVEESGAVDRAIVRISFPVFVELVRRSSIALGLR